MKLPWPVTLGLLCFVTWLLCFGLIRMVANAIRIVSGG